MARKERGNFRLKSILTQFGELPPLPAGKVYLKILDEPVA
jgi:hypothetical protein